MAKKKAAAKKTTAKETPVKKTKDEGGGKAQADLAEWRLSLHAARH